MIERRSQIVQYVAAQYAQAQGWTRLKRGPTGDSRLTSALGNALLEINLRSVVLGDDVFRRLSTDRLEMLTRTFELCRDSGQSGGYIHVKKMLDVGLAVRRWLSVRPVSW